MSTLYHTSSGRVIQGETTTYLAIPGGCAESGDRLWWIPCVTCTLQYTVRARTLRDMITSGRDPVCALCRKGVKFVKLNKWHFRYWLNRYSLSELLEIAESAYGPVDTWRNQSASPGARRLALEVLQDFPYQSGEVRKSPVAA